MVREWFSKLRRAGNRRALDNDLREEIEAHLDMQVEENLSQGMSIESARLAAGRDFGNTLLIREEARDAWAFRSIEDLWRDLRMAFRRIRRSPVFAAVAIITLALGVGANVAIFSVIKAVLLRPLPFPDPDRLMMLQGYSLTTANYEEWKKRTHCFESLASISAANMILSGVEEPERISIGNISADFFSILGFRPVVGRLFVPEDFREMKPVVVASEQFWRHNLGAQENAIGKTLILDQRGYTLVGVVSVQPGSLPYPDEELWIPLIPGRAQMATGIARLKPGISVEAAQAEARVLADACVQKSGVQLGRTSISALPLNDFLIGNAKVILLVLFGTVGFILLIACSNIANLLLIRTLGGARDIAMRVALGAGRGRIARQLLTEGFLVVLAGSAVGVLAGGLSKDLLLKMLPYEIPRIKTASIDGGVLLLTLVVAITVSLGIGFMLAVYMGRQSPGEELKKGASNLLGSKRTNRVRSVLVIVQMATALLLLIGAGLLIKTFLKLRPTDPGFDPANRLTLSLSLPVDRYRSERKITGLADRIMDQVRSLPAVQNAAVASHLPFIEYSLVPTVEVDGRIVAGYGRDLVVHDRMVSRSYFSTMAIRFAKGRLFDSADEAIINETMARRIWPGRDPLGQRFKLTEETGSRIVVGMVRDTRVFPKSTKPEAELYIPFENSHFSGFSLLVHTSGDPHNMISDVRNVIRTAEAGVVLSGAQTMEEFLGASIAEQRFHAVLLGILSAIALAIALIGIYGVISYSVQLQLREMGVRLALGAVPADLIILIVKQGLWLALGGVVLGGSGSFALTRYLQSLLFEVKTTDATVFASVVAAWFVMALAACLLPALRAAHTDPIKVLRYE